MAPVALAAVWAGAPWLALLVGLLAAGMAWEWARLSGRDGFGLAGGVMVLTAVAAVLVTALGFTVFAIVAALLGGAAAGAASRSGAPVWAMVGTWWIALPCVAFLWLAGEPQGRVTILWLLATVWASDSGAYAAGRALGGPRLAPRLSPNKTWAGVLGGMVAAGLAGWLAALVSDAAAAALVPAGLALGLAAQLGDLAESLAKRRFGVKDSSALIPGHGGLLDRLDGMLAAAAVLGALTVAAGSSPVAWPI